MHQYRLQAAARDRPRARSAPMLLRTDLIAVAGVSPLRGPSDLLAAARCVVVATRHAAPTPTSTRERPPTPWPAPGPTAGLDR